ncbi:UDP-N-acetylmuramoyl-L-alanyl-D-glutamate--2,6-diaminopimelate ligase [Methylomicrobium sp. Wu6]|uniref:UDP-N-acetylmuramoyl-L-alanyl-D-glutamate--2, 6-diaminopimelate ligase n=1 Tax=Methylomicrobium sp. Wu6 TaxID=3107928 RepID=UPI002DD6B399|nr:UDP-N-acetylmuramoyl-L-alanyl-D-glutamate--2,6-diaminopimelate ligase [Methylomicrobium sp. Wu6]MEC4748990.1 UDP-N-acetylmuramoyl-L-alanyl-D-glutamate--2,6-diaminopimelate ligase [Methylomicrobium sp. Wu6]
MKLTELLAGPMKFGPAVEITDLTLDSRQVAPGDAFIALSGANQHGLKHAAQAIERGAAVILYDPAGGGTELAAGLNGAPAIAVENLAWKLGDLAAHFYRDPSAAMNVFGITGTNGKTSCSQFLSQLLPACGIIGTLGWGEWGRLNKTLNTTPDALAVQRVLAELRKQGKKSVAMEVSSHGLEQGRVNGVHFQGAVFTNISRDHLDYHGTMEAYVAAKLALLRQPGLVFAAVNLDDEYSAQILAATPDSVAVWGHSRRGKTSAKGENLGAENIRHAATGIEFDVYWRKQRVTVQTPLFGDFNIDNCLSVLAVMLALGEPIERAALKLRSLNPVQGRMERFGGDHQPLVFVDYAHTPDALDKVLSSVRRHCRQSLWVVFGCGGNRDRGKRSEMGAVASRLADHIIVTDDNPRHENGQDIVNDILSGCRKERVRVISDRKQAIEAAICEAGANDWIVIAGKGHEDYQEIAGVRYPFSDAEAVKRALKLRANGGHAVE